MLAAGSTIELQLLTNVVLSGAAGIMKPSGMLPCRSRVEIVLAVLTTLWCGRTAGKLFVKRSAALEDHKWLIAYPCTLMYSAFALLTVY